jgi:hypothetical protein
MFARYIAIAAAACMISFSVQAQQTLEELVNEARAGWMFGAWKAQSDRGETVSLDISWDLAKNVVVLHVKIGEVEAKGYTVKDPRTDEIQFVSFDNKGAVGKGKWAMESEDLVLRTEQQSAERTSKMGIVFAGSPSEGLEVRIHGIDSYGDLETPARQTYKLKKQK